MKPSYFLSFLLLAGLAGLSSCQRNGLAQSGVENDDLYFSSADRKQAINAAVLRQQQNRQYKPNSAADEDRSQGYVSPDARNKYYNPGQQTQSYSNTQQGDSTYYNPNSAYSKANLYRNRNNGTLFTPRYSNWYDDSGVTTNNYYNGGYAPGWGGTSWGNNWGWNSPYYANNWYSPYWGNNWYGSGLRISIGYSWGWGSRWNSWYDPFWGSGWYGPGWNAGIGYGWGSNWGFNNWYNPWGGWYGNYFGGYYPYGGYYNRPVVIVNNNAGTGSGVDNSGYIQRRTNGPIGGGTGGNYVNPNADYNPRNGGISGQVNSPRKGQFANPQGGESLREYSNPSYDNTYYNPERALYQRGYQPANTQNDYRSGRAGTIDQGNNSSYQQPDNGLQGGQRTLHQRSEDSGNYSPSYTQPNQRSYNNGGNSWGGSNSSWGGSNNSSRGSSSWGGGNSWGGGSHSSGGNGGGGGSNPRSGHRR
jgi:hypothetical protein